MADPRYEVIAPKCDYDFYTVVDLQSDIMPNFAIAVIHKEMPNAEAEVRGIASRLNNKETN